jgi:hypothetical protein
MIKYQLEVMLKYDTMACLQMTKFHVISDKSWGTTSTAEDAKSNNGFSKKGRALFSGQVHPNVYFTFNLILQVHLHRN